MVYLLRMVPMASVMGTIFFLSHQPGETLPMPDIVNIDKLAHLVAYGVLAGTVIWSFYPSYRRRAPLIVAVVAAIVSAFYGISDEFHQSFIPMRRASWLDIIADICGAVFVGTIWYFQSKKNRAI